MKPIKFYLSVSTILVCCSFNVSGQSFDEYKDKYLNEFRKSKEQVQKEYREFRDKRNAEMEAFLRQAWVMFHGNESVPAPVIKEEEIPPVIFNATDRVASADAVLVVHDTVIPRMEETGDWHTYYAVEETEVSCDNWVPFSLYGTLFKVRFDLENRPRLRDNTEGAIADMWQVFSSTAYDNLFYDFFLIREENALCDWAYVKLAEAFAQSVYGLGAESVVFQSIILFRSGFKLVLGRDENSGIHMLLASDEDIFGHPYYTICGDHFYLMDGSDVNSMYLMENLPGELNKMRLSILTENIFNNNVSQFRGLKSTMLSDEILVAANKNLIDFYNDYPKSYVNNNGLTRYRFYAQAPLCHTIRQTLYPELGQAVAGKSAWEQVNVILNFVQTAFEYEYDDVVWGQDRAFFPDESIYYPYCDCEDRSILFSRLVRDILGLEVILFHIPGHLATAVCFNEDINGDHIMYNGKKYIICDPTYINAPVGMAMPETFESKCEIIEI